MFLGGEWELKDYFKALGSKLESIQRAGAGKTYYFQQCRNTLLQGT